MGEAPRVGKHVADHVYVHLDAMDLALSPEQCHVVRAALEAISQCEPGPNIVKYHKRENRFSLLAYPDFQTAPFPELAASWTQTASGALSYRTYADSLNPPILHRKELVVPATWPCRESWIQITSHAESLGLFDESTTIGFRRNWERLVESKGYQVVGDQLLPLGNVMSDSDDEVQTVPTAVEQKVHRHLTALSRTSLSAPVQLLLRSGLLGPTVTFFDYGCGKGGDVAGLRAQGYIAAGWDPYYAPDNSRVAADIVNLGFVINVIEDSAERAEAVRLAANLSRRLLAVSVMLHNSSAQGIPWNDGILTGRSTFQKYFAQDELREYLEHALSTSVVMAAPGIALAFFDKEWEQHYLSSRYRKAGVASRLLEIARRHEGARHRSPARLRTPREREPSKARLRREELRSVLDSLWKNTLDLGRWPAPNEVDDLAAVERTAGSLGRALRRLEKAYDLELLAAARKSRQDDVLLFLAMLQFTKRPPYKRLDQRLQRDIKEFFGHYGAAYSAAARLLLDTGSSEKILDACRQAAAAGFGFLESEHWLQLHIALIERLPVLLRAYVSCALVLWEETSDIQLVKIHISSGKLTLLQLEEFDGYVPRLVRRIKVNLPRLDYQVFDYGTAAYPCPLLFRKSRYLNEDSQGYARQLNFDEALDRTGIFEAYGEHGPSEEKLTLELEHRRLRIGDSGLERSASIPELDQACGRHFTYRSFIACGETQRATKIANLPLNPQTYNALYDLATEILDPVIDYFGGIRLTYGFCSPALARHIKRRIAPKLDQHVSCELRADGRLVCDRGGAACDFIVDDESMREVADWVMAHLPYDRLYFYGDNRPLHVSFGPQHSRLSFEMRVSANGALIPRPFKT